MTRAEEITEIRRVMANAQAFRELVAAQTTGSRKAEILAKADALIEKSRLYLAQLEHPDGATSAALPLPAALQ
jgi:hypothetical protein